MSFGEARWTRQFWILSIICLSAIGVTTGLLIHLAPPLTDLSGSLHLAASFASMLGLAAAVGRVASGFALDRWRSPFVGLFLFGSAAVGVAPLRAFGIEFGVIAIVLFGLVVGAEADPPS
jgi:hypothetical protein